MKYIGESDFIHGGASRSAVLIVNLGTPDSLEVSAVRRYLSEFLSDPRIVELPRLLWLPILHGVILRLRPKRSAKAYASIWTSEGSPLLVETQRLARALQSRLGVDVAVAMRYGNPSIPDTLQQLRARGVRRLLVLPLYPQYSCTTTASVFDALACAMQKTRYLPELRFINQYFDEPAYVQAMATKIRESWAAHGRGKLLVFSFHGVPKRYLTAGDPYFCHCHKSARLIAEALEIPESAYRVVFQSRFGREEWLQPYCSEVLAQLPKASIDDIDICCPAFAVDCLETLEEIAEENREIFIHAGGKRYQYIPCLNDSAEHVQALETLLNRHMQGWPMQPVPTDQAERERSAEAAKALGGK